MYPALLKKCVLDSIYTSAKVNQNGETGSVISYPTQAQVNEGTYWPERAHTMIGIQRLNNIEFCYNEVIKNNIPGDLIETGVWRGGATIFMAGLTKYYKENRKIFVADSFQGLPKPEKHYPADKNDPHYTFPLLAVDINTVKNNFKKYDLLDDNVVFIKGFFEHSLKSAPIDKLAILRLDGDMYSSTIQVLNQLYDKVSVGGYIIVDDYNCIPACKKAVTDFRKERNITTPIIKIDITGVYWKKE